jgi:imidazolonepropionase
MASTIRATLVVRRATVATCDGAPNDPCLRDDHAIVLDGDRVRWIGPDAALGSTLDLSGARVVDAAGRLVTPGLVDSHTHLVFGDDGSRAAEFAAIAAGRTYAEISRAGGGIRATMRATRAASQGDLLRSARARARRLLAWGVTTVEVKSGYGESVEEELRLLRVIRELGRSVAGEQDVLATVLPLHALPSGRDRDGWIREVVDVLLPAVAREGLATACDAFVAATAFSVEETRRVLTSARALGLSPRLHADQLSDDRAALLAAEVGAASADHLEHVGDAGVAALAGAGVVAGLLPTSTLLLRGRNWAPGRRLVDADVPVALGTNVNPGSAMSENLGLALSLACLENGLTPGEAIWAATRGGALALRLPDAGRLAAGVPADLVLWGTRSPAHLCWHAGVSHALCVVKGGRVVHETGEPAAADCLDG